MKVGTARWGETEFAGQLQVMSLKIGRVFGVIDFEAQQASVFAPCEDLAFVFFIETDTDGMRDDGNAAALTYEGDGFFSGLAVAMDVAGGFFTDVAAEGVFESARVTFVHKNAGKVGTAGQAAAFSFDFGEGDIDAGVLKGSDELGITFATLCLGFFHPFDEACVGSRNREVGEDVRVAHVAIVFGVEARIEFDALHQLEPAVGGEIFGFFKAGEGVVVGDGERCEADLLGKVD